MGIELHPILLSLTEIRRYHRSEGQLLPNVAKVNQNSKAVLLASQHTVPWVSLPLPGARQYRHTSD
jgi:hypothetical protein